MYQGEEFYLLCITYLKPVNYRCLSAGIKHTTKVHTICLTLQIALPRKNGLNFSEY